MGRAKAKASLLDPGLYEERLRAAAQSKGEGILAREMDNTGQLLVTAFQWASQKQHMIPTDSLTRQDWICSRKDFL